MVKHSLKILASDEKATTKFSPAKFLCTRLLLDLQLLQERRMTGEAASIQADKILYGPNSKPQVPECFLPQRSRRKTRLWSL